MGRTLPSFRIALDQEINSWKNYRRGLRIEDREYFDNVMRYARMHSDAGSLAARMLLSENVFLSALIEQDKRIIELKGEIEHLKRSLKRQEITTSKKS
ncbi:MAG: hypothetical protein ACTSVK_03115 [Promethearchaeota archaeon]